LPQSDNNGFDQAELHVLRARESVARQREIVARLKAQGFDTAAGEDRLKYLERTLAIFEAKSLNVPFVTAALIIDVSGDAVLRSATAG
jgi:hypothetical protein